MLTFKILPAAETETDIYNNATKFRVAEIGFINANFQSINLLTTKAVQELNQTQVARLTNIETKNNKNDCTPKGRAKKPGRIALNGDDAPASKSIVTGAFTHLQKKSV